jgi:hypothetical protein
LVEKKTHDLEESGSLIIGEMGSVEVFKVRLENCEVSDRRQGNKFDGISMSSSLSPMR